VLEQGRITSMATGDELEELKLRLREVYLGAEV
jgi:hypothetical protein